MPLRVLIIPDKFKGTLSAGAAADAIARGWRKARPVDSLDLLPMSDGGDGFGDVLSELLQAKARTFKTIDAAHRPCKARYGWEPKTKTVIVESARVVGLAMLPPGRFCPTELDTVGLGMVLRQAAVKGANRCLMGIGGTATNDAGFGLARALGWEFLDRGGKIIEHWTGLGELANIRSPEQRRWFEEFLVAVDVQNPLLGRWGATRIYGPQKGLPPAKIKPSERCLHRLAQVVERELGRALAKAPGAGAGGGLGFGLLAFAGARLEPGFDVFSQHAGLARRLRLADLVITGEGAIDDSTLMGKGVGQIATWCREQAIPCVGLAGLVSGGAQIEHAFAQVRALAEVTSQQRATQKASFWLARLAEKASAQWDEFKA